MKPAVSDPPEIEPTLWKDFGGNVGWDVGANCGQSHAEMTRRFDRVIAFEPAQECWDYLDGLVGPKYQFIPVGLSDVDTNIELVELPAKIDTGQLVTAGTTGMEWNPDSPDAITRVVPCRTVDSMIRAHVPKPDFLKIDVEGHELRVLYGARELLAIDRPDLLIEFHAPNLHRSIVDMLESYGYDVFTVRHPHYPVGSPMWFNHGWVRAVCK